MFWFRYLYKINILGHIVWHLLIYYFLSANPRRRQWQPTPVLLPGKFRGRRSLVGCSPWNHEESDMTERLHFHFSLSCIGEGNGNPLQCSCLENPREGGAWWAAVSGVAQSRTRLKWLSSSSSSSSSANPKAIWLYFQICANYIILFMDRASFYFLLYFMGNNQN